MTATTYTFPRASFIGFDQLFNQIGTALNQEIPNYPPHNVVKIDEDHYLIEIAVAGFKEENLDIEQKESVLTVTGTKEDDRAYIHKGISSRNFTRVFTLNEHVQVTTTTLDSGVLTIGLERVIPEDQKPRKIKIGTLPEKKKSFLKG
jgi:molecular chaperone IbpA